MKKVMNLVANSYSYSEVARKLGYKHINGQTIRETKQACKGFDTSHFRQNGRTSLPKYKIIKKKCPVCKKTFETKDGGTNVRVTCSYSCSNSHFRSGPDHPNWKESSYRTTCFYHHKKQCIVCNESNIVEVHHYDRDKNNNEPENLIPLCPTHHQYVHSGFRDEVEPSVEKYRHSFIENSAKK